MTQNNATLMGGISVFLLGLTAVLYATTLSKISWNNYRFKLSHMLTFLSGYVTFTAWQFTILFASIDNAFNFQAISVMFLMQSGIVTNVLVYLNLYENKFNLIYFLRKFMRRDGALPDPERTNDLREEIEKQKGDDDFLPSINDVFDMISIGKISEKKMLNAFGRGFQNLAVKNSLCKKIVNASLGLVQLCILGVYTYLVYDRDDGSKLGLVTSIAVLLTDFYILLMFNARIIERISVLSLVIFSSRLFILLGGPNYWVYGYLVTFVWLECIIALGIVQRRLPLNSEMTLASENAPIKKRKFFDLARVPEFIFALIAVSLVLSIVIAQS